MTIDEDAVCKHCHKVIATVPKNYCPRSPNHMHEPVESPETIDITPVGMTTPEGVQRVKKALDDAGEALAHFGGACILFFRDYEIALIEMVSAESARNPAIRDDWHQIQALMGAYQRKQETFLRAVAGVPAQLNPREGS